MNGKAHVQVGVASGLLLGSVAGWSPVQVAIAGAVAGSVARLPDMDNRGWWKSLDRLIPDEALGHGGPMRHRGILHWWGLPFLAAVWVVVSGVFAQWPTWIAWSVIAGWSSHIAADAVFGARSRQRGPGIPLAPWWWHVGFGLKSDGVTAGFVAPLVLLASFLYVTGMARIALSIWRNSAF